MAWLAFGWARPAFPADAPASGEPPAPTAQVSDDTGADSQPVDAVTFVDTGAAAPAADAPADEPASSLRLAPIAIRWGGDVGYDIEQRGSRGGNATLRQRVKLNLKGNAASYIMQPWIAQVRGDLGFTASKSKVEDASSSSNVILGGASLYLVPYSRFPFDARISRNQNYSGPGIGLPISQTTRFDMNQRYTPRYGKESYRAGYNRSQTGSAGTDSDRQSGLNFSMRSDRFKQQTLEADGSRDRGTRSSSGTSTLSSLVTVHHTYRESAELSLDNNASLTSLSEHAAMLSTNFRNRELNSTLSLQPAQAPYSVIGTARVNVSDIGTQQTASQTRVANANLGANYRPSQYITLSASGNINVTNSVRTQSLTAAQTANANIPLAAVNLGAWRYSSQVSGSVSNSSSQAGSVQSVSLGPGHSLNRAMDLGGGRLALGFNQGLGLGESTRSQATSRLTNSGSANWQRSQGNNNTGLRLNGRDSRSLSRTQDSFQSIDASATTNEQFSRYSTLTGSLTVRATRQENLAAPSAKVSTSSSASLRYSNQRAFGIPRLIFESQVQTRSQSLVPVLVATPKEQGPVTWENTLFYTVGRLAANFAVNLSKDSDGTTQSLIALSLKRYF